MSKAYSKPPTSIQDQITIIQSRGLNLDIQQAEKYLSTIGYYRLICGYGYYFKEAASDNFKPGTTLDNIINLYVFDQKLKLLILEAMERIEVSVRCVWANELSTLTNDSHCYLNKDNFKNIENHTRSLLKAFQRLNESRELKFITHYNNNYDTPKHIHIWGMVETLTFGELSHWVDNTENNSVKVKITTALNLGKKADTTIEILKSLTIIRNHIAHHGIIWNHVLNKQIPLIKPISSKNITGKQYNLGNLVTILSHILASIYPTSTWKTRLDNLIQIESTSAQQTIMGI